MLWWRYFMCSTSQGGREEYCLLEYFAKPTLQLDICHGALVILRWSVYIFLVIYIFVFSLISTCDCIYFSCFLSCRWRGGCGLEGHKHALQSTQGRWKWAGWDAWRSGLGAVQSTPHRAFVLCATDLQIARGSPHQTSADACRSKHADAGWNVLRRSPSS